ncbi:MAG: peptide ABC transporter ATP-binding protein, partial [Lachnospiraceae bacterium]|nr:peptide ABC transporter ATP-binding protein [Lachnospiraceae bacterium]
TPVDLLDPPKGCAFGPRCSECMKVCLENRPPMLDVGENGHVSSCWLSVKEMKQKEGAAQ